MNRQQTYHKMLPIFIHKVSFLGYVVILSIYRCTMNSLNTHCFMLFILSIGCSPDSMSEDTAETDTASTIDHDGDGYTRLDDCDDSDASVHPGDPFTCVWSEIPVCTKGQDEVFTETAMEPPAAKTAIPTSYLILLSEKTYRCRSVPHWKAMRINPSVTPHLQITLCALKVATFFGRRLLAVVVLVWL